MINKRLCNSCNSVEYNLNKDFTCSKCGWIYITPKERNNKHYCPKCKKATEFKYYHGFLGYESFICCICNWDIQENKLNKMKGGL